MVVDVDEDAMVAPLLETRDLVIGHVSAEAARGGENHPVCEENDGLDSPEYLDIFCGGTSGRALGPAGVKAARQKKLEFIDSAGVWRPRPSSQDDGWTTKVTQFCNNYRSRYVAKGNPSRAQVIVDGRVLCSTATAELFEVSFGIGVHRQIP